MPYPISNLDGSGGVASYQLGNNEEWTIGSLTALLDPGANGGPVIPFLYVKSPSGACLYAQPFSYLEVKCLVSAAFGGEYITVDGSGGTNFPQSPVFGEPTFVNERMPPLTLTSGCSLYLLTPDYNLIDPADPFATIDTRWTISDVLLWVEDTPASRFANAAPATPPGPYMLVPGDQLGGVAA